MLKVAVERRRQGNLRRGKRRPSENLDTGKAGPPRCLVRWQCDSPRSLITSRRSAGRDLGRNSAVSPAVSEPFLSRFSTQMDKKLGFEGQKRLKDHSQRHNRRLQHHPRMDMAKNYFEHICYKHKSHIIYLRTYMRRTFSK